MDLGELWSKVQTTASEIAAAAEEKSEHPLAKAIVTGAQADGIAWAEAREFHSVTGGGVSASVEGARVLVGALPAVSLILIPFLWGR